MAHPVVLAVHGYRDSHRCGAECAPVQRATLRGQTELALRVATLIPKDASFLWRDSVVLSQFSDDWETERAFLNIEAR